ncbi:hypothetical protein ACP6PL_14045 [Dapis sp. BLCC M126]|uniref:hypothetical protein n=1 Tax=Dapis sp. BLCC M126 TaxID=3400189 RepID=UPI003CE6DD68
MVIPDIPDGWKYVISSLVGGGMVIFSTFLNNRYQLNKDTKTWEKEKLWEGYQKSISDLNSMVQMIQTTHPEKIFAMYSEISPYLYWIVHNHPNPQSEEVKALKEAMENGVFTPDYLDLLKQMVLRVVVKDPRIFQK